MLSYPKCSNVDYGYWVTIENEYEINGLCLNIDGSFHFWMKILRKANMVGSTTYIFSHLILHSTRLCTNL
jgi:hypothetical protein